MDERTQERLNKVFSETSDSMGQWPCDTFVQAIDSDAEAKSRVRLLESSRRLYILQRESGRVRGMDPNLYRG